MDESTIFNKLNKYFSPTQLEVINESHKHEGHKHSPNSGNSHFYVIIESEKLKEKSRLDGQREIYRVLGDDMKKKIHALRVKIIY